MLDKFTANSHASHNFMGADWVARISMAEITFLSGYPPSAVRREFDYAYLVARTNALSRFLQRAGADTQQRI